jgi:hypothetical protein
MDRFFISLCMIVTFALTLAFTSFFESKSSAATFKHGIENFVKASNVRVYRSPSVMANNK